MVGDKLNMDIFWLKDNSLEDLDSWSKPDAIAGEIVANLEGALEHILSVAEEFKWTHLNLSRGAEVEFATIHENNSKTPNKF